MMRTAIELERERGCSRVTDGIGDGSEDGAGTEMRVKPRGRTQDGNRDESGDVNESNSGDENGNGGGDGNKDGIEEDGREVKELIFGSYTHLPRRIPDLSFFLLFLLFFVMLLLYALVGALLMLF